LDLANQALLHHRNLSKPSSVQSRPKFGRDKMPAGHLLSRMRSTMPSPH